MSWLIFKKEFLEIARDRRAVFLAFVLPLLAYPLLFFTLAAVSAPGKKGATLTVGISGDYAAFLPCLEGLRVEAQELEFSPEAVRSGQVALFLELGGSAEKGAVKVYYAATSPSSREARKRIDTALDRYHDDLLRARFAEKGLTIDPARVVGVDVSDASTLEERSASRLARILPAVLVVLLLTGGAFAALDLAAGEKERGTLETLYIHPVLRGTIVTGKLLVVIAMSLISLALNLAGFLLSFELSALLGAAPRGLGDEPLLMPTPGALGLVAAATVPLSVLSSSTLLAVSAFARSYREAQTYLFPLTLGAIGLVFVALLPQASLAGVLALVPVVNSALSVREALEGTLEAGPFAIALAASALYAALATWKAAGLFAREDLVLGLEPPPLASGSADARARLALVAAPVYLLALYYIVPSLQAPGRILWGLAVTLWGLVLVPALLFPSLSRAPFREALGLGAARWRSYLLAAPIAASAAVVMGAYMLLQNRFLPLPKSVEEVFRDVFASQELSPWLAVLLFAVSPGICEELLWRGAFQGALEPRGRPVRTVLLVGLFFGIFHFSAFRFVPTAALGCILALVRQRSGSIFPCMAVHALYNAIVLFGIGGLDERTLESTLFHPVPVALAGTVLCWALLSLRPGKTAGMGSE